MNSIVVYETLTIVFHIFVHDQIPLSFTENYSRMTAFV